MPRPCFESKHAHAADCPLSHRPVPVKSDRAGLNHRFRRPGALLKAAAGGESPGRAFGHGLRGKPAAMSAAEVALITTRWNSFASD